MRTKPKTPRAAASTRRARPAARWSVPRADATAPGLDPGVGRQPASGPDPGRGALQHIGGSQSDEWNDRLGAETVQAMPRLACETREQKMDAALQGLAGIAPRDELEGIMAAQMIAAHAAAMECYRRAANEERSGERKDHLNQAVRLSRASTTLLTALVRYRRPARPAAGASQAAWKDRHPEERAERASKDRHPAERPRPRAGGVSKGAKQPHAREIPPGRATRLDGLRRNEERLDREPEQQSPNWNSLSDQELAAMWRTGSEEQRWRARLVVAGRRAAERRRAAAAAAAAKAMPVAAQTESAEQPSGAPAPAAPPAPAAESAKQPSAAPPPAPPPGITHPTTSGATHAPPASRRPAATQEPVRVNEWVNPVPNDRR